MNRFLKNIKKYYKYAFYSAKAELKSEVADSYLNWIWLILEPICMMFIYTFIVQVVFRTSEPHFPVFVFIGLTCWSFFNNMIKGSIKLVSSNKAIVSKVYIPKYILLLSKSFVFLFKMLVSVALILVLMIIFKVPFTIYMLYAVPIILIIYTLSFGIGCVLMHFGVYVEDLSNVMNIILKLTFYLSGIFYNIRTRVPDPYNKLLLRANPIGFLMDEFRKVFIDARNPSFQGLFVWFIVGILFTIVGVNLIHKHENSYAKVI